MGNLAEAIKPHQVRKIYAGAAEKYARHAKKNEGVDIGLPDQEMDRVRAKLKERLAGHTKDRRDRRVRRIAITEKGEAHNGWDNVRRQVDKKHGISVVMKKDRSGKISFQNIVFRLGILECLPEDPYLREETPTNELVAEFRELVEKNTDTPFDIKGVDEVVAKRTAVILQILRDRLLKTSPDELAVKFSEDELPFQENPLKKNFLLEVLKISKKINTDTEGFMKFTLGNMSAERQLELKIEDCIKKSRTPKNLPDDERSEMVKLFRAYQQLRIHEEK